MLTAPTAPVRAPWQPVHRRFGRGSALASAILVALLGVSYGVAGHAPALQAPAGPLDASQAREVHPPSAADRPADAAPIPTEGNAGLSAGVPAVWVAAGAPPAPAALPVAEPAADAATPAPLAALFPPTVNVDDYYVELVPAAIVLPEWTPAEAAVAPADADPLSQQAASLAMRPLPAAPASPDDDTLIETGIASTYGTGDGFQGNLTACGQVFDTFVPQVAHKTLPCGTLVRVEDVATGSSVTVKVTDRGPYIPGRVVDLSWAAYRQLDPAGPGLREVRVYRVDE